MMGTEGMGQVEVHVFIMVFGEGRFLGLPIPVWLAIAGIVLVFVALSLYSINKRRRERLIKELQAKQQVLERTQKELFTQRKADEIQEAVLQPGQPKTVISEGSVAYTETGEMLVFRSTPMGKDTDAVTSAVGRKGYLPEGAVATWTPSYKLERVIALHMTGVVMFATDARGSVFRASDLDSKLVVLLERLLEEARWLGGEMVSATLGDRTVCLAYGEEVHMAAILIGEPDERLDRELRWAIGDLAEEFTDQIWSWGGGDKVRIHQGLVKRTSSVFNLTAGVHPGKLAAQSEGGGLRVTSTISWRNSLAEYTLGIVNLGPGKVYDIELLPSVTSEGRVEVVTARGMDVDSEKRMRIREIPQGSKAVASLLFRVREPMSVGVDCSVVYTRGVANVQKLTVPQRYVRLDHMVLLKGAEVEPERALELAIQPAAFRDRCALLVPRGVNPEGLFNAILETLQADMSPVVELEDDDDTQLEAWFHAELGGGGTVVAAVTVMPRENLIDLFASSTVAGVVPFTMVLLRNGAEEAAGQPMPEILDPELRTIVPRTGMLLLQSWGFFDEE